MPTYRHIPRTYLHFDEPIGTASAEDLATNSGEVSRHAFYPFIYHVVETVKVQSREGGGIQMSEPKQRRISYASHADSHIFSWYSQLLNEQYEFRLREQGIEEAITAFRSLRRWEGDRSVALKNIHFANDVFEDIRRRGACSVLAMDFSQFFDRLAHRQLKSAWCRCMGTDVLPEDHYAVFRAITKHSSVNRAQLRRVLGLDADVENRPSSQRLCTPAEFREVVRGGGLVEVNRSGRGIPQGSPISAVLANIYVLEFDAAMKAFADAHGGLYRRYCDDILVVMPNPGLRAEAERMVMEWCARLRLEINQSKTERVDFTIVNGQLTTPRSLQYLGFTFDGRNKRIRPGSMARYCRKMRKGVRRAMAIMLRSHGTPVPLEQLRLRVKQLYIRYSYLGRHNFLSYAFEAARIMGDDGIKKQVKKHWRRLRNEIHRQERRAAIISREMSLHR